MKRPTALELMLSVTIDVPEAADFGPDPDVTVIEPIQAAGNLAAGRSRPRGSTRRGARPGAGEVAKQKPNAPRQ